MVKWEWGFANFLHWEMGFEALRLGFCQWKTATGKGILAKLQLEIGFGKKKKKNLGWEMGSNSSREFDVGNEDFCIP